MQEFFYTIVAIWVIWKLFGMFSGSNSRRQSSSGNTYSQTTNNNYYNTPRPGDVRVEEVKKEKTRKNSSDDDYVDFEEIK